MPRTRPPFGQPDREAVETFIACLFRHADRDKYISLRGFHDLERHKPPLFIEGIKVGAPDLLDRVSARIEQAATHLEPHVFCPPVATFNSGTSAKVDDIAEGVALSVECDADPVAAKDKLVALLGEPTAMVASGGVWINAEGKPEPKLHLHWRLIEPTRTPEAHAQLRRLRELATRLVGADASAITIVHPLRWPGSWHRKNKPILARLKTNPEREIDLAEALERLQAACPPEPPRERSQYNGQYNGGRDGDAERARDALKYIPADDRETWLRMGMALHSTGWGSAYAIWADWSQTSSKYKERDQDKTWRSFRDRGDGVGLGSLFHEAAQNGYRPESRSPLRAAPRPPRPPGGSAGGLTASSESVKWRDGTFTGADLKNASFEPLAFLARNIIPLQGVTLLCSKPKFGKSWLAYDLCIGCAADRFILGEIKPAQGDVLYLALEDSKRRLRARMDKLLTPGSKWPEHLTMATEWRRLHEGGLDDIRAWHAGVVAKGGKPILVMIDVLTKVRKPVGNRQLYEADYDALTGLCKLANDLGLAIVVIHHTRKMAADDLMDTVSGSFAVSGAADAILVMANKSSGTVLDIRGRDVESAELAIEFNKATCRWTVLGNAAEVHVSEQRGKIIGALKEANAPMTVPALIEATGIKRNALELTLGRMAKEGEIKRVGRGLYAHKDYTPPDPEDPGSVRSVISLAEARQKRDRSQAAENEGENGRSVQSVRSVSVGTDGNEQDHAASGAPVSVPAQTDQTERQIGAQGIEIAPGFAASESVRDLSPQTDWTEAYPDFPDSLRRRCDVCGESDLPINQVTTTTGTAYLHPGCEATWLARSITLGSS
jgi:hypothetical protein